MEDPLDDGEDGADGDHPEGQHEDLMPGGYAVAPAQVGHDRSPDRAEQARQDEAEAQDDEPDLARHDPDRGHAACPAVKPRPSDLARV